MEFSTAPFLKLFLVMSPVRSACAEIVRPRPVTAQTTVCAKSPIGKETRPATIKTTIAGAAGMVATAVVSSEHVFWRDHCCLFYLFVFL